MIGWTCHYCGLVAQLSWPAGMRGVHAVAVSSVRHTSEEAAGEQAREGHVTLQDNQGQQELEGREGGGRKRGHL